jgi:uncharacterized membrane-anchored protein
MTERPAHGLAKVPAVTLGFWIIKVLATTLGETGGDSLSMSMNLGYLVSTAVFGVLFLIVVAFQISSRHLNRWLYWATIVATTTVGTTLADFVDRSLGVGYAGGSSILIALLLGSLLLWYWALGSVDISSIGSPKVEVFYWVTILFSQTLGTALGDWTADSYGLGFAGGTVIFSSLLLLTAAAYFWTRISHTLLFWMAFVLTRPFGAVLGDLLDKPVTNGGFALSRYTASAVLLGAILIFVSVLPQRPATSH